MINIAILEDDYATSEQLKNYMTKLMKEINERDYQLSIFHEGQVFLSTFKSQYDLILMDIELPDGNGMEISEKIREIDSHFTLIFITFMAKFALKGYEVDAADFIVKPVSYFPFSVKMKKAIAHILKSQKEYITIKTKEGYQRIDVGAIKYVEVSGHILSIVTYDDVIEIRDSLESMKKVLEPYHFMQCNVCYLINPKNITKVAGDYVYYQDTKLKISRPRKKKFLLNLANYFESYEMGNE